MFEKRQGSLFIKTGANFKYGNSKVLELTGFNETGLAHIPIPESF